MCYPGRLHHGSPLLTLDKTPLTAVKVEPLRTQNYLAAPDRETDSSRLLPTGCPQRSIYYSRDTSERTLRLRADSSAQDKFTTEERRLPQQGTVRNRELSLAQRACNPCLAARKDLFLGQNSQRIPSHQKAITA